MTNAEVNAAAIVAVERGERVKGPHSLHDADVLGARATCVHNWRTLFCDSDTDVVECSRCGWQQLAPCSLHEDYGCSARFAAGGGG